MVLERARPAAVEGNTDQNPVLWERIEVSCLFVTLFLIGWKWVDVSLLYHCGGLIQGFPSFEWGARYANDVLFYPGGLFDYVAALTMQAACFSWLGALVLSGGLTLLYFFIRECLRLMPAPGAPILAILPPLIGLGIFDAYTPAGWALTTLLFGAGSAYLWLKHRPARAELEIAGSCLLILLTAVIGPRALIPLTAILCGADLATAGRKSTAIVRIAAASLAPLLAALVYGFGWREIYSKSLSLSWDIEYTQSLGRVLIWALYGSVVLVFGLAPALQVGVRHIANRRAARVAARPASVRAQGKRKGHTRGADSWATRLLAFRGAAVAGILCLSAAATTALTHNAQNKVVLAADRAAWRGSWVEVLTLAKSRPIRSPYLACAAAQAMFHTGELSRQLPPVSRVDDLLLVRDPQIGQWRRSNLCLDLGLLNKALHHLTEAVEFWGERPLLLRGLAHVNLALGNVQTAQIYLRALSKMPFQATWAREQLKLLAAGKEDPEVGRLRNLNLKTDSVVRASETEEFLQLLQSNPANRMAFEYLLTYELLTRDLEGFSQNVSRIGDFPALALSPLWEEALLLAEIRSGKPGPGAPPISAESRSRYQRFQQAMRQCGNNPAVAAEQLRSEYGQDYFYYYYLAK